jgi:hypothetical protein
MAALSASRQALQRRYDVLGQQFQREERQRTGQEQEALQRRFASMGALGSGASVRAEQTAQEEASKRFGQAKLGLETARLGDEQRMAEIDEGRQFARGERIASQKFASGEAQKGRDFATSERLSSQTFQEGMAEDAFTQQWKMLEGSQKWQGAQNDLDRIIQNKQLDLDERIAEFNMDMAEDQANENKKTIFETLDPTGTVSGLKKSGGRLGGGWSRAKKHLRW